MTNIQKSDLDEFIARAFREDIADGDHTSLSTIPHEHQGRAQLIVKEEGIFAGLEVAKEVFRQFDSSLRVETLLNDGAKVKPGDIAFKVYGKTISILQCERLVLNILQHMSGIATETNRYVELLKGTNTRLLDTRKTTPGMRLLDKEAVLLGGGYNHRIGLFDMILIKDNHIDFAGGIEKAISAAQAYLKEKNKDLRIEVEVRSIADIERIMAHGGVHRIMFDNFTIEQTRKGVEVVNHQYETESSGMITKKNIREYALCGVDFISVGALTHHVAALDMSLKAF